MEQKEIDRVRVACHLLDPPAPTVICQLLDEIGTLKTEVRVFKEEMFKFDPAQEYCQKYHLGPPGGDVVKIAIENAENLRSDIQDFEKENEICEKAYRAFKDNPPKGKWLTEEQISIARKLAKDEVTHADTLYGEQILEALEIMEENH